MVQIIDVCSPFFGMIYINSISLLLLTCAFWEGHGWGREGGREVNVKIRDQEDKGLIQVGAMEGWKLEKGSWKQDWVE